MAPAATIVAPPSGAIVSPKGRAAARSTMKAAMLQAAALRAGLPSTLSSVKPMRGPEAKQAPAPCVALAIEFKSKAAQEAFKPDGVHVFSRFQRFADAYVPLDGKEEERGEAITRQPGFVRMEILGHVEVPPVVPGKRTPAAAKGDAERIVQGGHEGLKGRGVVVAVIDTGIDFRHPDFIRMEGGKPVSRLLALWDPTSDLHTKGVGKPGPVTFPGGVPVGTVFLRADLTADLRAGEKRIPAMDVDGHGTSCAGIAAGSGAASQGLYEGVAPEADLIGVRICGEDGRDLANTYLFGAALDWLNEVAGKRPLVVSCSWGKLGGPLDGRGIVEERVNARFGPDAVGRALCMAAGNEGGSGRHAGVAISALTRAERLVVEPEGDDASPQCRVELCVRNGAGDEEWNVDAGGGLQVAGASMETVAGSKDVLLEVELQGSTGTVWLWSASGKTYEADAYIHEARFAEGTADEARLVASPGTAAAALTVGSYDWNDNFETADGPATIQVGGEPMRIGALSSYSSPGPRRGDDQKPDLVAPGQWFTAPLSADAEAQHVDASGKYQAFNGTSAATPYTAGVVALLLERNPRLTAAEVQRRLRAAAQADSFTGRTPSAKAGAGKLNLKAVEILLAVPGAKP